MAKKATAPMRGGMMACSSCGGSGKKGGKACAACGGSGKKK